MPELYIITGSNGAGKSSVGAYYLPVAIREKYTVFDGDKLYMLKQKKLWASGITAIKEAKKIALAYVTETFDKLVDEALSLSETFVYEGHFTNDSTWDIPKKFKKHGYQVNMIFLGVNNPDISELRVIDRVKVGGHFVSRNVVEDNFFGNLEKLNKYFGILDNLDIIDTSETEHILLATFSKGEVIFCLPLSKMPQWFSLQLPLLVEKIKSFL